MPTETKSDKNTITLSFDENHAELLSAIKSAAEADERTPAKFLLRYLKTNFVAKEV